MCFSAAASFTSAGIIGGLGSASLTKTKSTPDRLFALLPLLFGIQQFFEGMVWILLDGNSPRLLTTFGYGFVFFSHLFWPSFIPYVYWKNEDISWRKKTIFGFLIIGILVTLYSLSVLLTSPLDIHAEENHLLYFNDQYSYSWLIIALYVASTTTSGWFSSKRIIQLFSIFIFFSLLITIFAFTHYLVSVWCFFAAAISGIIAIHFFRK